MYRICMGKWAYSVSRLLPYTLSKVAHKIHVFADPPHF
jgi:hypothetical protein